MNLCFGDWSSDDNLYKSGQPRNIQLDFSDGTSIEEDGCWTEEIGCEQCITFGRIIHTSYVKVTILATTSYEDSADGTDSDSNPAEAAKYHTYITDISAF